MLYVQSIMTTNVAFDGV